MSRTVFYVEVPNFYAEVERADQPALAGRPVVVGGDPRKRGVVVSLTPEARAAGVSEGMEMLKALECCPSAHACRTRMRRYREVAFLLRTCLARVLPCIEPTGLAAAFLDGSQRTERAEDLAAQLRRGVAEELRLPLHAGIATVKFLAKLASQTPGPEGVQRVPPGTEHTFLAELPIARLPGVGPNTEEKLAALAIRTVGQLAASDRAQLEEVLGNHGLALHALARGQGDDRVRATWQPQSLSQETTLPTPLRDFSQLQEVLDQLAKKLQEILELHGLAGRRIQIKLRFGDTESCTRSCTLPRFVRRAQEISGAALELLVRTQAAERAVSKIGVSVSSLASTAVPESQLELF